MPVWIWMSSGWIVRVGSEATDFGGSFSIVNTNAAPAKAKARPNILSAFMVFPLCRYSRLETKAAPGTSVRCIRQGGKLRAHDKVAVLRYPVIGGTHSIQDQ